MILPKDGREDSKRRMLELNHERCVHELGREESGVGGWKGIPLEGTAYANTQRHNHAGCVQRINRSLVWLGWEAA